MSRNASVYVHTFFSRSGYNPDPNDPEYDAWSFSKPHRKLFVSFTRFRFGTLPEHKVDPLFAAVLIHLPKPKADKRKSLLGGVNVDQGLSETPVNLIF